MFLAFFWAFIFFATNGFQRLLFWYLSTYFFTFFRAWGFLITWMLFVIIIFIRLFLWKLVTWLFWRIYNILEMFLFYSWKSIFLINFFSWWLNIIICKLLVVWLFRVKANFLRDFLTILIISFPRKLQTIFFKIIWIDLITLLIIKFLLNFLIILLT
jgi:hypothetical protein